MRYESLRREVWPTTVSFGQSITSDVNLASHAYRDGLQVPIEHVHVGIGDRTADGDDRVLGIDSIERRPDGGFSGPIHVPRRLGSLS